MGGATGRRVFQVRQDNDLDDWITASFCNEHCIELLLNVSNSFNSIQFKYCSKHNIIYLNWIRLTHSLTDIKYSLGGMRLFANLRKQFYDENIGQYEEITRTNHEQVQAKKRIKLMQGLGFFPATFFDSKLLCFLIPDFNHFWFDLTLTVH